MNANERELILKEEVYAVVSCITDHERAQMLNYLPITGLPGGVILNFKHARLEWERLVLTKEPRRDANKRQSEAETADFLAPGERL